MKLWQKYFYNDTCAESIFKPFRIGTLESGPFVPSTSFVEAE